MLGNAVFPAQAKQVAYKRQAAGDRREQEMFEKGGALSRTFVTGIGLGLFRKNSRGGVFHKVDTALIAFPAMWLFVVAGRTLE